MWTRSARLVLAVACVVAALLPLGERVVEAPLELRVESLPALAGGQAGQASGREHARVVLLESADIDVSKLAVDPSARRTWLVSKAPARVFDPKSLELRVLAPPRVGRPLPLLCRARGARDGDELRIVLDGQPLEVRVEADDAGLFARVEIAALAARGHRVRVQLRGTRGGREGSIAVAARLEPAAAPRVALAGVDPKSAFARALALQGFVVEEAGAGSPERAAGPDLWLADVSRPPHADLIASVDAGAGVLALARAASGVHEAWRRFLPVIVSDKEEEPSSEAERDARESRETKAPPDPDPQPRTPAGPPPPPDDKSLRRTGDVAPEEAKRETAPIEAKAVDLVLLIDKSGSMSGPVTAPAIVQAKRAAIASAAALGEGDSFALISFGARAEVELELGDASRKDALRLAVGRLVADADATRAYLALSAAWAQLKRSDAPVRHVLLLTDGEFTDQEQNYRSLVRAMQREGIGISAIASTGAASGGDGLNVGKFRFLNRLLRSIGGSIRFGTSKEIPRLVLGEVREVLSAARPLREGGSSGAPRPERAHAAKPENERDRPQTPDKKADEASDKPEPTKKEHEDKARTDPGDDAEERPRLELAWIDPRPLLTGLRGRAWPALSGALALEARPGARVHWALRGSGRTALATALHGLGRVVVWAGDDGSDWASAFVADARFPALCAQLASWAQAPLADTLRAEPGAGAPARGPASERRGLRVTERRILAGDGVTRARLREVVDRIGAARGDIVDEEAARAQAAELRVEKRVLASPLPRILGLLAALVVLLFFERFTAGSRRRAL